MLATLPREVIWHDVECGGYAADLALYGRLASQAKRAPILDLGAGCGRVALALARAGHPVTAVDQAPELVAELERRAQAERLAIACELGDVRELDLLPARFGLILAPMQLVQLLEGPAGRLALLRRARAHLAPGGRAAVSIVEGRLSSGDAAAPLADVREEGGAVFSSLPISVAATAGEIVIRRERRIAWPGGEQSVQAHEQRLDVLDAATLSEEARQAGLATVGIERLAGGERHVDSTVILLEAADV
ncbi:MAG: hypothetical protein QOG09_1502 [Solirubrobacterales bacterium]|jgi:2-polyprenyl-3-methyl-5-hydroxy-6-metoxy-1,4-benzoquinol methylase|nr:hypothetical protein [Solirubrobacterales bacterium]